MTSQGSLFADGNSAPAPIELCLPPGERHLVIRASAGTGKTFQLANRFLTILRTASADRILASTFTRKAAGEITDRILHRLAEAAIETDKFSDLKACTGEPELQLHECLNLIKKLTQNLHRLRISTLDGFFARLATSFSLELSLPPGWRIMDETEAVYLQDRAIESLLREGDVQELKNLMHQLDKGSTRRSVHQLISEQISSFHEIYLRTSQSAWEQFGNIKHPTQSDLQQLAERLAAEPVEDSRMSKARIEDVQRLADEDWEALTGKGLLPKVLGDGKYYKKGIPDGLKQIYRELRSIVEAKWLAPWALQNKATYQLLTKYNAIYEQLKRETGGLRFDDVTRRLAKSLSHRNTNDLAHRLDGAIEHILLDEFQDTSVVQWDVIRPFATDTAQSPQKSFFCVGDGKQAIYGWRGGEATIFDAITHQLPDLTEQPLNKSYRSSQVVIDVVNRVFQNITAHDGIEDGQTVLENWRRDFPDHKTARSELPGHFCLRTSPIPPGMQPGDKNKAAVDAEQNRFVAQLIAEQLQRDPTGTIGVLTRNNSKIGEIIFELNALGIDASEEGGNPLTDSAPVQAVLSLFRWIDHPGHDIAFFHVANSPLGKVLGTQVLQEGNRITFAQQLRKRLLRDGFGKLIFELTQQLAAECKPREIRRLTQLTTLADEYDSYFSTLRTSEFVTFVEQQKVQEPTDARVRVMTIHQSKGLQFDTVYLCDCENTLIKPPSSISWSPQPGEPPVAVASYAGKKYFDFFPDNLKQAWLQTKEKQLTESLCLLYVAITRAIHSLQIIIHPKTSKSKAANFAQTHAGLLRAALAPTVELDSDVVLYETGDLNWQEFRGLSKPEAEAAVDQPVSHSKIRFSKSSPARQLPRIAPSQKSPGSRLQLEHILPQGNSRALSKGTLFHAWLEQITWYETNQPSDEVLSAIARKQGFSSQDISTLINEFRITLSRPEIASILTPRNYLTASVLSIHSSIAQEIQQSPVHLAVANERTFAFKEHGSLVNGSIDRLVTISRGDQLLAAEIIDFKTDDIRNDVIAINERVEYYRPQLLAYTTAISKLYQLSQNRISAKLALLKLGRVIPLNDRQSLVE